MARRERMPLQPLLGHLKVLIYSKQCATTAARLQAVVRAPCGPAPIFAPNALRAGAQGIHDFALFETW